MFNLSVALAEVRRSEGAIALRRTVPLETPPWSDRERSSDTRSPTRRLTVRLNPTTPKTSPRDNKSSDKKSSDTVSQHQTPTDSPRYRQLSVDLHTGRHTEIRLLRLQPGRGLSPVSCELIHTALAEPLEFDALSYCWGAVTPRAEAYCDGRRISVTPNLNSALRALRHGTRPRMLWVDAVCINQADLDEKKIQVPLMGQIYSKAAAVQIWLGDDTPERTLGTALKIVRNLARLCYRFGWDIDFGYLIRHRMFNDYGLPDVTDNSWDAVRHLAETPWFSRTWIIQEVVLSRRSYLHCGEASLPWSDFCVGWLALGGITPGYRPDIIPSVSSYAQVVQLILSYHKAGSSSPLPELLPLLENHRNAMATDPRDKVYGFLGLYERKGTRAYGIIPDYRRAVSEAFIDAARRIVEHDPILNILGVPKKGLQYHKDNLPSWVPDWSADIFARSLSTRMIDGTYTYNFDAAKVHENPKQVAIHESKLELSGHCFDEVIRVGSVADPYFKSQKGSDHLRLTAAASMFHMIALGFDWLHVSGALSEERYPGGQDMFEAFVRTMYLDDFSGRYSVDDITEYYRNLYIPFYVLSRQSKMRSPGLSTTYKYACLQLNTMARLFGPAPMRTLARVVGKIEQDFPSRASWKLKSSSSGSPWSESSTQPIIDLVNRSIYRRMFLTRSGYFGLGPQLTQRGDRVFLVKGCRTPLMLRAQGDGWALLGDCYVHGIMHGEAFDKTRSQCFSVI